MIVVVTAFDDAKVARLPAQHVHALIRKPFDVSQLVTMIREVVAMWQAQTSAGAPSPAPPGPEVGDDLSQPERTN